MANLGTTFDANAVEPQSDFAPLPAGDYLAMIVDSQMKDTKTGRGQYLELTLQVVDGPMAKRLLWDRLTLIHDNAKTVEINQRKLSSICHAVGVLQVSDSMADTGQLAHDGAREVRRGPAVRPEE